MASTLDRIAKVLNQAENASTPEEAATFMQKAQELASLAAIDLAVARSHTADKEKREQPTRRAVTVNSYNRRFNKKFFMDLFTEIAEANDVKCTVTDHVAFAHGFPSDIDISEALFGSLSVQMVSEADAALKRGDNKRVERVVKTERVENPNYIERGEHATPGDYDYEAYDPYWHRKTIDREVRDDDGNLVYEEKAVGVDGRTWRQNFYLGFIAATRGRLWEAKRDAEKRAGVKDEGSEVGIVLADKKAAVKEVFDEELDRIRSLNPRGVVKSWDGPSVSEFSDDAVDHGRAAGRRAKHDVEGTSVKTQKREALS